MNPICTMPGGKHFQGKEIVLKFPEHRVYIEPFVGAGGVFFRKEPSPVEIINDKDPELAFAFRYIKKNASPPKTNITYVTRKEFLKYRDAKPQNDEERFLRVFILH